MSASSQKIGNPFHDKPDFCFWRRAVSKAPWFLIDPVAGNNSLVKIAKTHKVASAGSCFAQHIAKTLRTLNFNYLITEDAAAGNGGQAFSAQYGNIYTARQLLQLFERAFDLFHPDEQFSVWRRRKDDLWLDAFRPTTCVPQDSPRKIIEDRKKHLSCVKELFEKVDYFIFTLGLTECWRSKRDGAVYPVAPGVINHNYDPLWYEFHNLSVYEVVNDLAAFIARLRSVNEHVKIILTVSPVPLIATYENSHVLTANTYSKSVLRVAAQEICDRFDFAAYFPSYEIFTGTFAQTHLFSDDMREVLPSGVKHAMKLFSTHFLEKNDVNSAASMATPDDVEEGDVFCDEDLLE